MPAVVTLSGELDISRYPSIRSAFDQCPQDARCVLVDLSKATFIDSIFMTELLLFMRRRSEADAVLVVIANGNVLRTLVVAGIHRRISVVPDRAGAMKIFDDVLPDGSAKSVWASDRPDGKPASS